MLNSWPANSQPVAKQRTGCWTSQPAVGVCCAAGLYSCRIFLRTENISQMISQTICRLFLRTSLRLSLPSPPPENRQFIITQASKYSQSDSKMPKEDKLKKNSHDHHHLAEPMSYMRCQVTFRQGVLCLKNTILHDDDDGLAAYSHQSYSH